MVELREHERRTLLALQRLGGKASLEELMDAAGLFDAAVMRAALTLQEKKVMQISEQKQTVAKLNTEGKFWAKKKFLPERGTLSVLFERGNQPLPISYISQETDIPPSAIPVTLGWLVRKEWATIDGKSDTIRTSLDEPPPLGNDEKLLDLLRQKKQVIIEELDSELQKAAQDLKKRQILDIAIKTKRFIELTDAGWVTIKKDLRATMEVTQLTPELIISGKWRKVKMQRYNIKAPVARTWPGKKHPYLQFLDEVKGKLVALGFKEMTGTATETAFFNFDALYTPQGHPARDPSGVYYVKSPKYGKLDAYRQVVANVKKTHENGWKTGSIGWMYRYLSKEAGQLVLRSHTTCLSARTLLSEDLEVPGMYFSIGRCYRPEMLDKTHLTEFNQVEGIVVDKDLTLRDLLGVLEKFAIDIAGADKAKFVPDYFPFTEPSVELRAYKKGYGWIEFGGSGIFRPEVTLPLGIETPVLAWGLGIDRLFMMKAGINDIRKIFSLDLDWLRKQEAT